IGTFYQPKLVWSDLKTLKTLPHRQFISGMAEVVKSAMIGDKFLFDYLDKNLNEIKNFDEGCLQEIVSRSCNIKARIVEIDEMDFGLRMLLNYGHTIGHALESLTEYKFYTHGEAISIGMMVEAKISHSLGHLSLDDLMRQEELLKSIGLPTHLIYKMPPEEIVEKLFLDKKARNGKITFALPEKIGKAFICHDVPVKVITKALEELAN
ncbi:MAG: 3-dehydroquinate synthase family protein, partial [Nitrososphaerota archaeon]